MALVPMAKIEVIGPKNRFFDVVSLLHEQGNLHIEDLSKKIRSGELPLEQMQVVRGQEAERERMEDLLIRVRSITKALHLPGTTVDEVARQKEYLRLWQMDSKELAGEIASVVDEVEDRTSALAASQADIESELQLLARYEPILQKIQPLARQIVTTGNFESVALLIERRYKGALEQLKEELSKLTKRQCEIVSTDVDEDTTAAIVVFNKAYSEPVHKFLAMENVNQIRLPSDLEDMPFDQAYDEIKQRRQELPSDLDSVRTELELMSAKWYLKLATIRDVLTDKIDEISAIPKFGQTDYAFVITGWLPTKETGDLKKEVGSSFGTDVIVNQLAIDEKDFDQTPVAMKNAKAVEPFQQLLGVYGTPKYGTLDPSWFLFFFYPLFFGMIVGDVGYGLIMLGIVLFLRFRYRDNENIRLATSILGPAATMVIVFGFIYGEFFGDLMSHYLGWVQDITFTIGGVTVSLPFHRTELVTAFMYFAIAVGVIHVLLGLTLGLINAIRTKHRKHIYEKGGILTFLVAIGLVVVIAIIGDAWGSWGIWAQVLFACLALLAFIFAIRGGGVMGAVDTVESVAHMASYIRIMAVGLAGAIFADAVNSIVAGIEMVVLAAIVGILLHSLNFLICAFSPTIHALRLNFLEFFGKFYETGSEEYSPFQKTGGEKGA